MTRATGAVLCFLALFKLAAGQTDYSPPGRPTLTSCLSRDKETFTCWWAPSEGDDLQRTTYALYYFKENSDVVYTCPDYQTAGEHSCFFNKNNTSIWVNYNITVAARNAHATNFSEPVVVDVAYIVQPHTPENLTVAMMEDKDGSTFFRVSWEPPRQADTRSGWMTLVYELRARMDGAEWEEHFAGQQKMFNMFSLRSGGTYLIQVRCKPVHGFWSEWSLPVNVTAPTAVHLERFMWMLIAFFSAVTFLILSWILSVKSSSVKNCLLPPVPRPRIQGLDIHLLKKGGSGDLFNALVVAGRPLAARSDSENLLVYLEVCGQDEQELILAEIPTSAGTPTSAGPPTTAGGLRSPDGPSDSDSGHGSCDSQTMLMEKCGGGEMGKDEEQEEEEEEEEEEEAQVDEEQGGGESQEVRGSRRDRQCWERRGSWERKEEEEEEGGDMAGGRVKTWPSVFTPSEMDHTSARLSSSVPAFPSAPVTSSAARQAGPLGPERLWWPPDPRVPLHANIGGPKPPSWEPALPRSPFRATEYVEVQRVNQENMVVLWPLSSAEEGRREAVAAPNGEQDYSRVKGLASGNMLLLQRATEEEQEEEEEEMGEENKEEFPYFTQEKNTLLREDCYTAPPAAPSLTTGTGKPVVPLPTVGWPSIGRPAVVSLQEDTVQVASGYVDTAMAMMPTH